MKKYVRIAIVSLIAILLGYSYIMYKQVHSLKEELRVSMANEKSLINGRDSLNNHSIKLQLTIKQLEYYNDSLLNKMDEVRKELNIKNKNLKEVSYLLSQAQKTDTIMFRDTLFRDKSINIDTLLGDEWYKLGLKLRFPNAIIVNPQFTSKKYIVSSYKKETIYPPKKFFLFRWFQKKHKLIEVHVVEMNPYIDIKEQRFIEIIK